MLHGVSGFPFNCITNLAPGDLGSIDFSGVYCDEPAEDSLRGRLFFAFCLELAVSKVVFRSLGILKST